MKLEFKEECKDRYTGRIYHAGDIEEFEAARAKEILAASKGRFAKEVKKQSKR